MITFAIITVVALLLLGISYLLITNQAKDDEALEAKVYPELPELPNLRFRIIHISNDGSKNVSICQRGVDARDAFENPSYRSNCMRVELYDNGKLRSAWQPKAEEKS